MNPIVSLRIWKATTAAAVLLSVSLLLVLLTRKELPTATADKTLAHFCKFLDGIGHLADPNTAAWLTASAAMSVTKVQDADVFTGYGTDNQPIEIELLGLAPAGLRDREARIGLLINGKHYDLALSPGERPPQCSSFLTKQKTP